jgi:hypothetical protein
MTIPARSILSWRRAALCCAVALAALVLLPRAASAHVVCNYDPAARFVNVFLHSPGDHATIVLGDDEEIYVQGKPCGVKWFDASAVYVSDVSGADTTVQIDLGWEWVVQGYPYEGGSSELEFWVEGGAGEHDAVQIVGHSDVGMLALGEQGINLNVEQELYGNGVDTDISIPNVEEVVVAGYDWVSGQGGLGTGQKPFPRRLVVQGSGSDDFFEAGDGPSVLSGGDGNDVLVGGAADDTLDGGPGDDDITGAGGLDEASYAAAPTGVSVDLSIVGSQSTGGAGVDKLNGVERLTGSAFADRLAGSAGAEQIDGGAGGDTIVGGAGADMLRGGAGLDTIDSRDDASDSISCGEGPDTLATDALDTLAPDCPRPPDPGGTTGTGSTGGSDSPSGPAAGSGTSGALAPVLTLGVPRQSLARVRSKGLRVVLRCSTDCHASGRWLATRATARRLGLGTSATRRTLGRLAPVSLTAGSPRSVRVRLNRAARRALRHARSARTTLSAQAVDGAGRTSATARKTVTLRA